MDAEEKRLLVETNKLAEKNYKLLKKLHKSMVWDRVWSIVRWIVIIGLAVGSFYFIQPYVDRVFDTYNAVFSEDGEGLQSPDLRDLVPGGVEGLINNQPQASEE